MSTLILRYLSRWLKGNDIETGSTGSDYWAAYVGVKIIKKNGLKQQTRTNVIDIWPILGHLDYNLADNWILQTKDTKEG